jgi:2-haloacid dehalogenase
MINYLHLENSWGRKLRGISCMSFDCYGTLVDWESGIKSALVDILDEKRLHADVDLLYKTREDLEFDLIQSEYRSYREILALSLREAFNQHRIPYSNTDGEKLAESVSHWPVFPDAKPTLERLAKKYRLCIISNVDNDIIGMTRDRIGVRFDAIVTAEDAQAYKPSIRPFQVALQRLGCKPVETLHVSSGFRYDVPPAHQLGFKTAWVNRKQERAPSGLKPDLQFASLEALAQFEERT